MRLAYVTAHLPPDFTSGATLQVERLARRAAELGHEVEVLSGAISMGLGDGELRTETLGGVVVHWLGTAGRIDQDDDGNWDNPLAASAAQRWLRHFEPDVVHVHTVQTLGVGVVEAALDAGRRVVVTMHDLWWWCPRLFLVDTALRPCPMVTDVDTCACARTPPWRAERAHRLRRTLARVDEILTPSAVLRDVVIANGVDPARVTVDENDVTSALSPGAGPARSTDDPVRFLYLGGDSDLKGADVVLRAARLLADRPGWALTAYGMSERRDLPDQAHRAPPFDPEHLSRVLGAHDVLLIPSIARESFSIAAREALTCGLAVITSDCLGPEEVVRDDHNGIVVPTGDADALAGAMSSLIDDPQRLARLRTAVRTTPVAVRSTEEHVDALLARYRNAPDRRPPGRWNVAFVVGADGAIARYRVHHPREALELHDASTRVAHYLDPALDRIADGMDAVVLQRVPATRHVVELIGRWRADGLLVVFDVDDLIVDPGRFEAIPGLDALSSAECELYLDGLHRYRTTLEHCDGAIVPTSPLADSIARTTGLPVAVVPNGLGLVELRLAAAATSGVTSDAPLGGRTRLAYFSGSDTHQPDLDLIAEPLAEVLQARAEVELLLVGRIGPSAALSGLGDRVRRREFQPWTHLYDQLATVDVNLAPLVLPSEFNEAKSAIKWLEAGAVGVPTVASASTPFAEAIDDGRTGVLCHSAEDWCEALLALVDDREHRRRIGRAARRRVELAHGPHVTAFALFGVLDELAGRRSDPRPTSWDDRAPDERAPSAPPLEVYDLGVPDRPGRRFRGRERWRRLLRR